MSSAAGDTSPHYTDLELFERRRCIEGLHERRAASAVQIAYSKRTLRRAYDALAAVGASSVAVRQGSGRLSAAVSPSLARAYMVARRIPCGPNTETVDDSPTPQTDLQSDA